MQTTSDAAFDALLETIYDAVTEPTGFQGFVEAFVRTFDLKAAMMLTANVVTQESKGLWVAGMATEWIEKYAIEFAGQDMLAGHIATSPLARFYATNLDLDTDSFVDTAFYRRWVVPQNIAYASGAVVLQEGPWSSQVILQRRPDQPPFTRDELDSCNRLVPHLQRAIQLRQRFAELELGDVSLAAGLDLIAMPSMLVDEFGRVVTVNRAARDLLDNGSVLRIDAGHLRTSRPELTQRLNLEIVAAVRASRGDSAETSGLLLLPREGMRPLILMVSPIRLDQRSAIRGGAVLFVYDAQSTPNVATGMVERLFNLTEAEAELAVALCAGRTLDEAAAGRGTSVHTVRSQLKSLFHKTGTNRQADLIALLLSSPAYFMAGAPMKA